MQRIGMGLVGPGFVGAHHVDAVRRLGFVDVVAIADVDEATARTKARALGVARAYGSFEALAADPAVHVVHNTTPNFLHGRVTRAALSHGKHIVSEKPLAMSADEARSLWLAARDAGVVHAVTFNYRGNPMVQQARAMVAAGEIGRAHYVHGAYLQDWLLKPTDFSWRLEPDKGGASSAVADIGSHWFDLVQHVSGLRIESVLADLTTVVSTRYKPRDAREAFATSGDTRGEPFEMRSEDLATILLRFEGGAKGSCRSARCAQDTRTTCGSRSAARRDPSDGARKIRISCGWAGVTRPNCPHDQGSRVVGTSGAGVCTTAGRTPGRLARRLSECAA